MNLTINKAVSLGVVLILVFQFIGIQPKPQDSTLLRVISFNIHQGLSSTQEPSLPNQISLVKRVVPDIVLLQETSGLSADQSVIYLEETMKVGLGLSYSEWGHTFLRLNGLAIFSRFPIIEVVQVNLANDLVERGALHITVNIRGVFINIINVHLSSDASIRKAEVETLVHYVEKISKGPIILGGDFNTQYSDWTLRPLFLRLGFSFTGENETSEHLLPPPFVAFDSMPFSPIDFILSRDLVSALGSLSYVLTKVSDHPLVYDVFVIPYPRSHF